MGKRYLCAMRSGAPRCQLPLGGLMVPPAAGDGEGAP